jgi:hypothetical protein
MKLQDRLAQLEAECEGRFEALQQLAGELPGPIVDALREGKGFNCNAELARLRAIDPSMANDFNFAVLDLAFDPGLIARLVVMLRLHEDPYDWPERFGIDPAGFVPDGWPL